MRGALYGLDPRYREPMQRAILWSHVRAIVRDLTGQTSRARFVDALALAPTLRFEDMPQGTRVLFRIALEQMPMAQDRLTSHQLDVVMCTPALTEPLVIRTSPHGLSQRYHDMGVYV